MAYTPTPAEREELAQIQQYLKSHAEAGTVPAEGSFTRVLRNASANVRAHVVANKEFAEFVRHEGGRSAPFAERLTIDENKLSDADRALLGKLGDEEIAAGVLSRMGTTASQKALHYQPPTARDHITAAFDAVESEGGHL